MASGLRFRCWAIVGAALLAAALLPAADVAAAPVVVATWVTFAVLAPLRRN